MRVAILDGTLQAGEWVNVDDVADWLGISRAPISEAVDDLIEWRLISDRTATQARIAQPGLDDRTAILQTLGALVGGVVRVSVGGLSERGQHDLLALLDHTVATVRAADTDGHSRAIWGLVDRFMRNCPNPVLVAETRNIIEGLIYRVKAASRAGVIDWAADASSYGGLRAAVAERDAIAAELAIERIFGLPASGSNSPQRRD
ncbi:hypothetical protein [Plantibacter sp. RU18]|uniref:hypothetical protein n=1 Tax=Plantibacter sp. RU18 TaxID=3158143 RepID=UPI003D35F6E5